MQFVKHTVLRRREKQRIKERLEKKRLMAEAFADEVKETLVTILVSGLLVTMVCLGLKWWYDLAVEVGHKSHEIMVEETLSGWQTTAAVHDKDLILICILVLALSIYAVLKKPK